MTDKAEDFIIALQNLCRQHKVVLAVSGYDSLQVWDLELGVGLPDLIHSNGIEDKTGGNNGE